MQMNILRCVFLNCHNLFPVDCDGRRSSQNLASLNVKINNLAKTLQNFFIDAPPDLISLCEINQESLALQIINQIKQNYYSHFWSDIPSQWRNNETGLITFYNHEKLVPVESTPRIGLARSGRRVHWMASLFQLQAGSQGAFWWIANHWKSRMLGKTETLINRRELVEANIAERVKIAEDLGKFYRGIARELTESAIFIGDFNCEPGERPFHSHRFGVEPLDMPRVTRERALVLGNRNRLTYLYAPMWRLMSEMDPIEGPTTPKPWNTDRLGTFAASQSQSGIKDWMMLDQIMITKPILSSNKISPLRFLEASLCIKDTHGQCSDHRAIGACFEY
jgi:hypothetical protein